MWADFEKIREDENEAVYAYGYESHKMTGKISFNKKTYESHIIRESIPDNNEQLVRSMFFQVYKQAFPQKTMIAIG